MWHCIFCGCLTAREFNASAYAQSYGETAPELRSEGGKARRLQRRRDFNREPREIREMKTKAFSRGPGFAGSYGPAELRAEPGSHISRLRIPIRPGLHFLFAPPRLCDFALKCLPQRLVCGFVAPGFCAFSRLHSRSGLYPILWSYQHGRAVARRQGRRVPRLQKDLRKMRAYPID